MPGGVTAAAGAGQHPPTHTHRLHPRSLFLGYLNTFLVLEASHKHIQPIKLRSCKEKTET